MLTSVVTSKLVLGRVMRSLSVVRKSRVCKLVGVVRTVRIIYED